jgi:hypothetical protein
LVVGGSHQARDTDRWCLSTHLLPRGISTKGPVTLKELNEKMDLRHLRREARTAVELALVALAPSALVDRLAMAAGLLEALTELPANDPPIVGTVPRALEISRRALDEWAAWQVEQGGKRIPRS